VGQSDRTGVLTSNARANVGSRVFVVFHWRAGCTCHRGGIEMNWDTVEGNWKQMKGKMKEKWGKLTDDDWNAIGGKKDQFIGKLQERYGYSREQAEKDYDEWDKADERTSKVA
jgi:uncharacterized protein YjbJ (UPF0337 family)